MTLYRECGWLPFGLSAVPAGEADVPCDAAPASAGACVLGGVEQLAIAEACGPGTGWRDGACRPPEGTAPTDRLCGHGTRWDGAACAVDVRTVCSTGTVDAGDSCALDAAYVRTAEVCDAAVAAWSAADGACALDAPHLCGPGTRWVGSRCELEAGALPWARYAALEADGWCPAADDDDDDGGGGGGGGGVLARAHAEVRHRAGAWRAVRVGEAARVPVGDPAHDGALALAMANVHESAGALFTGLADGGDEVAVFFHARGDASYARREGACREWSMTMQRQATPPSAGATCRGADPHAAYEWRPLDGEVGLVCQRVGCAGGAAERPSAREGPTAVCAGGACTPMFARCAPA